MARNDLDEVSLESLIADEKAIADLRNRIGSALGPYILDELRVSGEYKRHAERARTKRDEIARSKAASAATLSGSRATGLRLWFFERRLCQSVPEDIEDFARQLGFAHALELDTSLHREWMYLEARRVSQIV